MTNLRYYAGIGSRETPDNILKDITYIADKLEYRFILRTGNADGADFAFMQGSKTMEIFNPWHKYNNSNLEALSHKDITLFPDPTLDALELAAKFHPAWNHCRFGVKKLHARNCHIILGYDLKTPVEFVVCWHNNSGGTMQGVRIAQAHNIPVFNLKDISKEEILKRYQ